MSIPPTFILSLDCEGKWGMADVLRPYHHRHLTNGALERVYGQLLAILLRLGIPATFAFVMAFTLTTRERAGFPVLDSARRGSDAWLDHYWKCLEAGLTDGWHAPEIFELVRGVGQHEIASHGFCHRPLGEGLINAAGASEELYNAAKAAAMKQIELKTLVFPRNEVGNLPAVRAAGYLGFRSRLERPGGVVGRVTALLDEFAVRVGTQPPLAPIGGLVAIPPGRFFNWRFGIRKLVPASVTRSRWRSQLRACAHTGGVVHMWLHPHNLVTAPTTTPVLAQVLEDVARMRDQGRIEVLTQGAYCERALFG